MTDTIATWGAAYEMWCEDCGTCCPTGLVTNDLRVRCPQGHLNLGPGPTGSWRPVGDEYDEMDELAAYAECGILRRPCPRCGDAIEEITAKPGNDDDHTAAFLELRCRRGHILTW